MVAIVVISRVNRTADNSSSLECDESNVDPCVSLHN